jgi:hypothetical protein
MSHYQLGKKACKSVNFQYNSSIQQKIPMKIYDYLLKTPLKMRWFRAGLAGLILIVGAGAGYVSETSAQSQTNVVIPRFFFGLHGLAYGSSVPVPYQPWGLIRSWDHWGTGDITWAQLEPSQGTFTWTAMDAALNAITYSNTVAYLYCFGNGPSWVGGNAPTNIAAWDTFITNFVTRYHTRIKYLETWNEAAAGEGFYTGTTAMLVQMEHDLYTITKSIDPTVTVLSPDATGGQSVVGSFFNGFFAAGGTNSDAIAFHGYNSEAFIANQITFPEEIIGIVGSLKTAMNNYGQGSKPIFCTEGDWGAEGTGQNQPTTNDATAFLARHYLLMWSLGVSTYAWYAWDYNGAAWQDGQLWTYNTGPLNEAGIAYQKLYYWMVGAKMTQPYAESGSVFTCGFTRPGGYQALAVWNTNRASTSTFTVPSGYVQYRDLAGNLNSLTNSVTIGIEPILLENMNEPIYQGLTSHTNTYGAASVTLTGSASSYGAYPPSGTAVTVTINGNAQGTTTSDTNGDFSINYNTTGLPANVYTVTYSNAAAGSLPAGTDTSSALTFNQLPVVLTGTEAYNGTTNASASILSVSNLVGSDNVTLSGSVGLASANPGAEPITSFSGLTLGGTAGSNYTLTGASGTVTITALPTPVFFGLGDYTIPYGTASIPLSGTLTTNGTYPPNGTAITVTINGNAQGTTISDLTGDFSINYITTGLPAGATPYVVTYSSALGGGFNSAISTNSTLTVNQLPVVLTGTEAYNGATTASAAILSVANLVGSDNVTLNGSVGLGSGNPGAEPIVSFAGLTLGGTAGPSYTLAGASGTVTITAAGELLGGLSVSPDGTQFIFSYPTVSGQTYQLEYTTDLSSGAWLPMGSPVTGTGAPVSVTNSISSSTQMFFQLSITTTP